MNFLERPNAKGDKITFYYDFGRGKGQRPTTGIFIYAKPKDQIQKNHNKEALTLIEVKRSQAVIEKQSIGTAFIPGHKFKTNFLDYYEDYVKGNTRNGNRHLSGSLTKFKAFIGKDFIAPVDITENLCKGFRNYLLGCLTGESPKSYFARFKWVVNAAESDGYFTKNPVAKVHTKCNPSTRLKSNLETEEYLRLLDAPCTHEHIKPAFLFCCYTGLRWVDVEKLSWPDIKGNILTTRIIQAKTGLPVTLTLHPIAQGILNMQRPKTGGGAGVVFSLPTYRTANTVVSTWVKDAGIDKYVTWSCARLSFSILLQDQNVDDATVAYLMGHASTDQVRKTYKRYRPKNQEETISLLPAPKQLPAFLMQSAMR